VDVDLGEDYELGTVRVFEGGTCGLNESGEAVCQGMYQTEEYEDYYAVIKESRNCLPPNVASLRQLTPNTVAVLAPRN
jgi:hypothetical protein